MAIEELENLNRDLAAIVQTVAELGGGELTVGGFCREVGGDVDHLADGLVQKEVIRRDLDDNIASRERFQQPADVILGRTYEVGNVGPARRTAAEFSARRTSVAEESGSRTHQGPALGPSRI